MLEAHKRVENSTGICSWKLEDFLFKVYHARVEIKLASGKHYIYQPAERKKGVEVERIIAKQRESKRHERWGQVWRWCVIFHSGEQKNRSAVTKQNISYRKHHYTHTINTTQYPLHSFNIKQERRPENLPQRCKLSLMAQNSHQSRPHYTLTHIQPQLRDRVWCFHSQDYFRNVSDCSL